MAQGLKPLYLKKSLEPGPPISPNEKLWIPHAPIHGCMISGLLMFVIMLGLWFNQASSLRLLAQVSSRGEGGEF